jgi:hypothetical protein
MEKLLINYFIIAGPDLEARFGHLFQALEDLPAPPAFRGFTKTYPSKNGKNIITRLKSY